MKDGNYIIYQNYKGFKNYENILMSLIVGLHNSKKQICFSNTYASLKCGVSTRTISDVINKFTKEGYIKCYYNNSNGRIIHLINPPTMIDVVEECGIENISTPIETTSNPIVNISTPIETTSIPIEATTNNNIDYIIDNNDTTHDDEISHWERDTRFVKIIDQFPKQKQVGISEAYDYTWQFLEEKEKQEIERTLPTYISRNETKFIKQVKKYFNERFWNVDEITLNLLKDKNKKPNQRPKIII